MAKKGQIGTYGSILLWVFHNKKADLKTGDILFSQTDLRQAANELKLEVRNFPDLTYNLRSRAPLPEEIKKAGYTTIAIRGRGEYALVTAADNIEVPTGTEVGIADSMKIPAVIRDILRADEQSVLSAMRYMDVVSDFVGMPAYHLQGHLRTTGSLGQQVEADDVWVAQPEKGKRIILPIEAKGPKEHLGRHQMMSTVDAVRSKIPGFPVVPLAVHLEQDGLLSIIEFGYQEVDGKITSIAPTRFKRYEIVPELPLWP